MRQAGRAECYAHEDADQAGHNGHDTSNTKALIFGSSGISGKHGVRCKEGYDPWIVRLGPAEESDTLMKARTRRGHDGHDRTKQRLCLLSGLCPLCPALSASS